MKHLIPTPYFLAGAVVLAMLVSDLREDFGETRRWAEFALVLGGLLMLSVVASLIGARRSHQDSPSAPGSRDSEDLAEQKR